MFGNCPTAWSGGFSPIQPPGGSPQKLHRALTSCGFCWTAVQCQAEWRLISSVTAGRGSQDRCRSLSAATAGSPKPIKMCAQLISSQAFLLSLSVFSFVFVPLIAVDEGCISVVRVSLLWSRLFPGDEASGFWFPFKILPLRRDGHAMFQLYPSGSTLWKTVTQKFYFLQAYREDVCRIYGFPRDGW